MVTLWVGEGFEKRKRNDFVFNDGTIDRVDPQIFCVLGELKKIISYRSFEFYSFLYFGYCLSLCFLACELPYRELERRIGAIS